MNCRNCNAELEDGTKLCPECGTAVDTNQHSSGKVRILSAVFAGFVLTLALLLIFIITKGAALKEPAKASVDLTNLSVTPPTEEISVSSPTATPPPDINYVTKPSGPIPNLFYIKYNKVHFISGELTTPKEITIYPDSWSDLFYTQVSEDGRKLFYPDQIDYTKTDFTANLMYCDLTSEAMKSIKLDTEVNNFTVNQDGSKVYYLKNKELYVSNLSTSEKLATDVIEFYISKEGDRIVYRTSDCRLFHYTVDEGAKEIDSNAYLQYASEDLSNIYYFKDNSLYQLKDGKDLQLIDSGLNTVSDTIIHIYEDGSLYYLKPRQRKDSDDAITNSANCLYYYSNGKSTLVSEYCTKVWRYSDDQSLGWSYPGNDIPVLAFTQLKNATSTEVEQYICRGSQVLKKFADGDLYQLVYDIRSNKIYYVTNYNKRMERGDLYYSVIDSLSASEGTLHASKVIMYDPYSYIIGDNVIYLKNGINRSEDFVLYVNDKEIESNVTGWIYRINNSDAFIYISNFGNDGDAYTSTLNLYKDGEAIKIADHVSSYYAVDDNNIAYVTIGENYTKQLFLYDGSGTRILIDSYKSDQIMLSDFVTPSENQYYSIYRPTFKSP